MIVIPATRDFAPCHISLRHEFGCCITTRGWHTILGSFEMSDHGAKTGLLAKLDEGPVICAEGYLFEFERRGYLQAGAFVPEIVLEHPELVRGLHGEFVHAGSDVVEAFTYYAHREKLRMIGKEDLLEPLNREALKIAKRGRPAHRHAARRRPLQHQRLTRATGDRGRPCARCSRSRSAGRSRPASTSSSPRRSRGARRRCSRWRRSRRPGLPSVVTLAIHQRPTRARAGRPRTRAGALADAGADVVGLNCVRGPARCCR